jgi:hypothetical protein
MMQLRKCSYILLFYTIRTPFQLFLYDFTVCLQVDAIKTVK